MKRKAILVDEEYLLDLIRSRLDVRLIVDRDFLYDFLEDEELYGVPTDAELYRRAVNE